MGDNETRWFNHLLWLESVRQKSSVLPERFGPAHWSAVLGVDQDRVEEMIRAMAREDLIAFTESGELVIFGTYERRGKMAWKRPVPDRVINPYRKTTGWKNLIPDSPKSVQPEKTTVQPEKSPDEGVQPEKSPTGKKRKEEDRKEEDRTGSTAREAALVPAAEVIRAWNEIAEKRRWPKCSKVPDGKAGELFRARLKEPYFAEHYPSALAAMAEITWNKRPFKITTLMRPDTVRALVDGEWGNKPGVHTGGFDLGF